MYKQIRSYVTYCTICHFFKKHKSHKINPVGKIPWKIGIPFSDIAIDYTGPFMISQGFKYILVATFRITKYYGAKPYGNAFARTTKFLLGLILTINYYGIM